MARLSYRGRTVISEAVKQRFMAFDSQLLEDRLFALDDGDELSHHYAEAIAGAQHAAEMTDDEYGWDDDLHRATDQAVEGLEAALEDHLDVLVAKECAVVAQRKRLEYYEGDEDEIEAAVNEAREWLDDNQRAAERAGVLEEVTA